MRIKPSDLRRMFWRSTLIQGSWNFQCLIGLGFCYCALPVARRLFSTETERQAFVQRHLEFFNAHPYFVSWCLGAVARLEEEGQRKKWGDLKPISVFKERMSGPLGAVGDRMFWSGIKPLSAAVGVWTALLVGWPAIAVFLLLYNVPHFFVRIRGLQLGYCRGFDVVSIFSLRRFQRYYDVIASLGLLFTGLTMAAAAGFSLRSGLSSTLSFALAIALTLICLYHKRSVSLTLICVSVFSLILGYFL